jgi:hypothetical protein
MYPAKPDVDCTYGYIMQYENSDEFQYANGLGHKSRWGLEHPNVNVLQ